MWLWIFPINSCLLCEPCVSVVKDFFYGQTGAMWKKRTGRLVIGTAKVFWPKGANDEITKLGRPDRN